MKMKTLIRLALGVCTLTLLTLSTPLFAQLTIPDITGVKSVDLSLACTVTLIQGDKASLSIKGDEDALNDIHIKFSGERLKVYNDKNHQHKNDISITITVPDLKELSIGGVVDITTPNQVNFDNLKLEVSGVADLDLRLKSSMFNLEASGVLSGEVMGETKDFKIEISGVGRLDASEFKSENCEVEVSGVAKASVYAVEKLDASVSGMGRINYKGRPIINRSCSGFGSISKL
jgi:hypothetical protein